MHRFCFVSVALSLLASSGPSAGQAPPPAPAESFAPTVAPDGFPHRVCVDAGRRDGCLHDSSGRQRRASDHALARRGKPPRVVRRGGRLFFSVAANDTSRVLAIDADGSHKQTLATVTGRGVDVAPDGRRYVYWTGSWTSNQLFLATLDGAAPRALSDGATTTVAWNARVSPDGTEVATVHTFGSSRTSRRPRAARRCRRGQRTGDSWLFR